MNMKKFFSILALALSAAALCACGGPASTDDPYEALNKMLQADYSEVALTVTTTFSEDLSLTSSYIITDADGDKKVSYSVERFPAIDPEGSAQGADGEFAPYTLTGEAVYRGGELISATGEAALPAAVRGLCFRKEYFTNVQLTGVMLRADVTDAAGFLGTEIVCTDMKVEATFLEYLFDIGIGYLDADGNRVEYVYRFTV